jgi:oxalate decarboxylase/phosphoglucose isomerase-like protein (cupin superfamily)
MSLMAFRPGQRWRIHAHREQEEVYVVLSGVLTLLVEDLAGQIQEHAIRAGQAARVPPGVRRQAVNRGPEAARFLAIGAAGSHERWDATAWESWEETGAGHPGQDVPLPPDLPLD